VKPNLVALITVLWEFIILDGKVNNLMELLVTQLVRKFRVYYGTRMYAHKSPWVVPILRYMNSLHSLPPCFFKIRFNIRFQPTCNSYS
jgi:hypothetical protein